MRRRAPRNQILVGDAADTLATLPDASVDCVVTSPPYFQLRDYGVHGQLGLEERVEQWVSELMVVMGGLSRILRPSGTLWLNLGDSYSRHQRYGAPPKSLLLGPERLALAMVEKGWVLRNKVTWGKPNPLPVSVGDRLNATWEVVYTFALSRQYFYDLDAIREPVAETSQRRSPSAARHMGSPLRRPTYAGPLAGSNSGLDQMKADGTVAHPLGKNPGDLWIVPNGGYRGAHFATFPPALIERPIKAGCPERVCLACGAAWVREHRSEVTGERVTSRPIGHVMRFDRGWRVHHFRGELHPTCDCQAEYRPGLVLDPFMGAGTVGLVANRLGRDWLGIELNPDYAALATQRIADDRKSDSKRRRRAA